jgi:hypothetical protein
MTWDSEHNYDHPSHNMDKQNEGLGVIMWLVICVFIASTASVCYGFYKIGYGKATEQLRSNDMNELITLRQVMQNYPSSIVVINCEQQKKIQHKLRKGYNTGKTIVSDSIYFTGECK